MNLPDSFISSFQKQRLIHLPEPPLPGVHILPMPPLVRHQDTHTPRHNLCILQFIPKPRLLKQVLRENPRPRPRRRNSVDPDPPRTGPLPLRSSKRPHKPPHKPQHPVLRRGVVHIAEAQEPGHARGQHNGAGAGAGRRRLLLPHVVHAQVGGVDHALEVDVEGERGRLGELAGGRVERRRQVVRPGAADAGAGEDVVDARVLGGRGGEERAERGPRGHVCVVVGEAGRLVGVVLG